MCTGKRLRHNDKKEIGFKSRPAFMICINVGLCPFLQFSNALSRKKEIKKGPPQAGIKAFTPGKSLTPDTGY